VCEAGGRYVHAPVLGSVPAVRGGTLVTFAGGTDADLDDRTPAHFTLAALAKDLRVARDASGVEPAALARAEAAFAKGTSADDDITALAR
jgi:hypothetical protein